jgi:hypothetical protein
MYTTIVLAVHVAISLVAILAGFVVAWGLVTGKRLDGWTALFLVTTVLTSLTGFLFPVDRFLPSHAIAILSLVVLAAAIYACYTRRLTGGWRLVYVIGAVAAFYLNFFVLVVQAFLKVPPLHELAPQGNEPPFAVVQLIVLAAFVVLGVLAAVRFRVDPADTAPL